MESTLRRRPVCSGEPVEEYEEDDEEDEYDEEETPNICSHCNDPIDTGMEVFLLQLVNTYLDPASQIQTFVLMEDDEEPTMEPIYFDFTCFEDRAEEIGELVKDGDLLSIIEPHMSIHCDYCQSSVRVGEKFVSVQLGEFELSERTGMPKFTNPDETEWTMCLPCATRLLVYDFEGIDDVLTQNGECANCTNHHCWRMGRCGCSCHRR